MGRWGHVNRLGYSRDLFAGRGVPTSPSLRAAAQSMKRFPSVRERFAAYCEECG